MQKSFTFSTIAILTAIAHWDNEPFTQGQLKFLMQHFLPKDDKNAAHASYSYGLDDIQSFILETLDEYEPDTEQPAFIADLDTFIKSHPHCIEHDGTAKHSLATDTMTWDIQDENGDYERLHITLNLIS